MTKLGRRKRKTVSSSLNFECCITVQQEEDRVGHRTSATMAANNASATPALIEMWKVLMQIKTNTEKLV